MNQITLAQSGNEASKPLVFEAATIKPSGLPNGVHPNHGGPGSDSPTLYHMYFGSIQDMIGVAWNVKWYQVASKIPIDRDRFDLVARLPEGSNKKEFREMFQNLLAERFALKVHMETRDVLAYEMVVSEKGLKVKEGPTVASSDSPSSAASLGSPDWRTLQPGNPGVLVGQAIKGGNLVFHMQVQQQTLANFARWLHVDLPLIDHTGMTGTYTFTLDYGSEIPGATKGEPSDLPSLQEALRSQVGVELVKRKLPFPVVVVDSVNRTPTDN